MSTKKHHLNRDTFSSGQEPKRKRTLAPPTCPPSRNITAFLVAPDPKAVKSQGMAAQNSRDREARSREVDEHLVGGSLDRVPAPRSQMQEKQRN